MSGWKGLVLIEETKGHRCEEELLRSSRHSLYFFYIHSIITEIRISVRLFPTLSVKYLVLVPTTFRKARIPPSQEHNAAIAPSVRHVYF